MNSILAIRNHSNESVYFHALNTQIPVTDIASPALDPFCLVKSCNATEAVTGAFYFITPPRSTVIVWMLYNSTCGVRPSTRSIFKLNIFEKLGRNRSDLSINREIWKVYEVEINVNSRLLLISLVQLTEFRQK